MTHTLQVRTTIKLDDQFLRDILTTAVEGGINYWAAFTAVERNEDLDVIGFEGCDIEDDETRFSCVLSDVVTGLGKVTSGEFEHAELLGYVLEQDACMIDADFADTIIQLGLFGEIVYG